MAPWIISHIPPHRVYTEAFGGAASVLMRKTRSELEIYNDLNLSLVNLFRVLQRKKDAHRLVKLLRLTPFAREEYELSYRKANNSVENARRFIIRSFMGFGSNACSSPWRTGFRGVGISSSAHAVDDWQNYPPALLKIIERVGCYYRKQECNRGYKT
jgi:DNA adenine methylase